MSHEHKFHTYKEEIYLDRGYLQKQVRIYSSLIPKAVQCMATFSCLLQHTKWIHQSNRQNVRGVLL